MQDFWFAIFADSFSMGARAAISMALARVDMGAFLLKNEVTIIFLVSGKVENAH